MAKAGRPKGTKNIATPEIMWELFCDFRTEKKANPILVADWVGKDANMVNRKHQRPLTLEGFSCWLFEKGIVTNVHDYFTNKNDSYQEYSSICRVIKDVIRTDQIEGGMCGIYNPSITQRLNGLVDKSESKGELSVKVGKDLADESYD